MTIDHLPKDATDPIEAGKDQEAVNPELSNQTQWIASLTEEAARWSQENGPAEWDEVVKNPDGTETRITRYSGMTVDDFAGMTMFRAAELSTEETRDSAARLFARVVRHAVHRKRPHDPEYASIDPATEPTYDAISKTAAISPSDLMRYAVAEIKKSGFPLEGSDVELKIADAVRHNSLGVNRGKTSPDQHVNMVIGDVLSTPADTSSSTYLQDEITKLRHATEERHGLR